MDMAAAKRFRNAVLVLLALSAGCAFAGAAVMIATRASAPAGDGLFAVGMGGMLIAFCAAAFMLLRRWTAVPKSTKIAVACLGVLSIPLLIGLAYTTVQLLTA